MIDDNELIRVYTLSIDTSSDNLVTSLSNLSEALTITQYDRILLPHAKRIKLATVSYFGKQSIALQRAVRVAGVAYAANAFVTDNTSSDIQKSFKRILDAIALVYLAGMVLNNRELKLGLVGLTVGSARVLGYNAGRALTLPEQLNTTTRKDITKIVNIGGSASDIKELFVGYATNRAALVGNHEARKALAAGRYGAILEESTTGLGFEKKWLTAQDDRVDEECIANGDEDWIHFGSPHKSGDQYPPGHIGCRCFEVYKRIKN